MDIQEYIGFELLILAFIAILNLAVLYIVYKLITRFLSSSQ